MKQTYFRVAGLKEILSRDPWSVPFSNYICAILLFFFLFFSEAIYHSSLKAESVPSREPSVSGNFCSRIKGVKYRVALQGGTWDFPGDTGNFGVPLVYTAEYDLAPQKNKILSFVTTWMDLENIMLRKINQTAKKIQVEIWITQRLRVPTFWQ